MPKIIKYYRKSQYGQDREFVHPDNKSDGELVMKITNQKTLTPQIRNWFEAFCPEVKFQEVVAPQL